MHPRFSLSRFIRRQGKHFSSNAAAMGQNSPDQSRHCGHKNQMDQGNLQPPNRGDTMIRAAVPPRRDAAETLLMRKLRRLLFLLSVGALAAGIAAYGQDDSPSLGEVARQSRLQKLQKDAQAKDGTPAKDTKSAPSK